MTLKPKPEKPYMGLVAKWYDRLLTSEGQDIEFYSQRAAVVEGSILELACGTGRILVPIRRASKEIDGIDLSSEMLAICHKKLEEEGLSATLSQQDMTHFRMDRRYDMIFIAGASFQLVADLEQVQSCLECVRSHLNPGGFFLLDVCRFDDTTAGTWEEGRTAKADSGEFRCRHMNQIDPKTQIRTLTSVYELYMDGQLARTEESTMRLRWYEDGQLADLLRDAGFSRIEQQHETIIHTHTGTTVYAAWT